MAFHCRQRNNRVTRAEVGQLFCEGAGRKGPLGLVSAETVIGEDEDLATVGQAEGGESTGHRMRLSTCLLHQSRQSIASRLLYLDDVVRAEDADRRLPETVELTAEV